MELKPGYKQTEVGVIPEDWRVCQLGEVCSVLRGGSPRPIENYLTNREDGINWIKIGDVGAGAKYIDATSEKILQSGISRSRYVQPGDFLLSNSMSFGRPYILRTEGCIHDGWLVIGDYQESFSTEYLYYCLSSNGVLSQYARFAAGSSVLNLNKDIVSKVHVAIPEPKEQRSISEVLGDLDNLLGELEELITKKRNIKQAAMQELLTGKRRLPGFEGEWEMKKLGDTASLKARIGWQGLTTAEYLDSGDFYLVTGTEIEKGRVSWHDCHYVDEARYKQDKFIQLRPRDVLVTKDGTIGKIALVTDLPGPATLNSGIFVIRPTENSFNPEFFYYLLCSQVFSEFLGQLAAGSTINHLYQKDFVSFSYRTPPANEEQAEIASTLNAIDGELIALQARLDKTREIKQGMMQDLLAGRIRLQ